MACLSFPQDFLWGTATAAHQVEGQNVNNDWYRFECEPGAIRNGDTAQISCGWWTGNYRQDFELARAMGQNTHRLSVEWSRIEPSEGKWDPTAIQFYREMLSCLRGMGMVPMVTLYHYTTPLWLVEKGGWENPESISLFARLADKVVDELGDLCNFWCTLNEPFGIVHGGYIAGTWPPNKQDLPRAVRVTVHLLRAHATAYWAIKHRQPDSQIGIAHHVQLFEPANPRSPLDRMAAGARDWVVNRLFMDAPRYGYVAVPGGLRIMVPEVIGTQDYIGLNYYYAMQTAFDLGRPLEAFGRTVLRPETQKLARIFPMTGDIDPKGLEYFLLQAQPIGLPVYILENGVYEADETNQSRYLVTHLQAVYRALRAGLDVRGYFWWSLVDNFEWNDGYTPRFGLYRNDLQTQVRTPKPVAAVYERIIRENGIPDDLIHAYGR